MKQPAEEWMNKVALEIADSAQPQLVAIVENAAKRHGLSQITLSQPDTVRVGMLLAETQNQSFLLGVQLTFEAVARLEEGK